tara:strand:+ start:12255 stop:13208 length:954 start_codon:yes stop_codon:yes gene_type:complete
MIAELLKKLITPIPARLVEQRPGAGGRKLDYVEWHTKWLRVLAVAPDACWEIVQILPHSDGWIVTGRLTIAGVSRDGVGFDKPKTQTDKKTGDTVAQESDNGVKAAATDALSRACTLHGIGLELYGADTSWFQRDREANGGGQESAGDDEPSGSRQEPAREPPAQPRAAERAEDGQPAFYDTADEKRAIEDAREEVGGPQKPAAEIGLLSDAAAGALMSAIPDDDVTSRRRIEYDLRERLGVSMPIVLARMEEAVGRRGTPNAFEALLRQGKGQGVTLSKESLLLLLHLLVSKDMWQQGGPRSVAAYFVDVKAGEAA